MKNLFLLLTFIFVSVIGFSQAPANAKTIIITMPDSITTQEKVTKVFTSKDYPIKTSGKYPIVIEAGPKTLKNNARVIYTAQIKGKEIVLKGRITIAGQGGVNLENKGGKDSPILTGWQEMEKIAKALGGVIKYE